MKTKVRHPLWKFDQFSNDSMRSFIRRMSVVSRGGCWEWSGYRDRHGYGIQQFRGKRHRAHRIAHIVFRGAIPAGIFVCHKCDNPPCCNPDHLFLGTQKDNMADASSKMRTYRPIGILSNTCKLTESKVIRIRRDYARGGVSTIALAQRYGCQPANVHCIVALKNWKYLPSMGCLPVAGDGTIRRNPPIGERSPLAKLKARDVVSIRAAYLTGRFSQQELGTRFGVNQSVISRVVNHKKWTHVSNE